MTASPISSQASPPLEELRFAGKNDCCSVIASQKTDVEPLDGRTYGALYAGPPDIEDIREHFYARLEDLSFPKGGIPGILLEPPCRPWRVGTWDLEPGFLGPFEGQGLAPEWTLVHGYLQKSGLAYAWLEDEVAGVIYDTEQDLCFTSGQYPKARGVIEVARYTVDEAEDLHHSNPQCPYGPWFEGAIDPDAGFYAD